MAPPLDVDLALPGRVVLRPGAVRELGAHLAGRGPVLLVTGRSVHDRAVDALGPHVVLAGTIEVSGEPTLATLAAAVDRARQLAPSVVLGIGGGSVLDTAKVVAALVPNRTDLTEHLKVVGDRAPLEHDPLPVVAVPTTFGTGAEMTHNAVVRLPDAGRKVSLRDRRLTPVLAVVDPDLGVGVPPAAERAAAFDAVVQLLEAAATPLGDTTTRAIAMAGAAHALPALRSLVVHGTGDDVRQALAFGAAASGIALANAKLGTVHGFAGVLGGLVSVAHGELCALFAGPVLTATIDALVARGTAADQDVLRTYAALAQHLADPTPECGVDEPGPQAAHQLPRRLSELVASAGITAARLAPLRQHDPDDVVAAVAAASSTRGNPVSLEAPALRAVLREVLR